MHRRILFGLVVFLLPGLIAAAAHAEASLSAEEKKLMAEIDSGRDDFGADLRTAVQIDSATENQAGVRQVGELFLHQLAELGFDGRFVPLPASTGREGHLVAEHKGTKGKRVLLLGHLDTVFPGGNFHREGNQVAGSGVADMKGGDIIMIHALRALYRSGLLADRQIIVVMSGDEEAPGTPLAVCRQDLIEAAKRSDLVLAFESVVGKTGTVARRGFTSWHLTVQGATGHSSGIFSDAVGAGAAFEAARILAGFYDELRKIDGITLNPALLAGGTTADLTATGGTLTGKTNIIPQRVMVRGDLRFLSASALAEAQEKMEKIVATHLPRTSAELTFDEGYPAMSPTPENYALLKVLDVASRDLGYGPMTAFDPRGRGAGDVSFVSPPLPGLDGLGLGGEGEHSTHETADLSDAPELIRRTALLIYRLTR